MKHYYICLFLLFTFHHPLISQNFTGKVIEANQEPVSGTTVYIKEIRQGLICNAGGEFQTTLPDGKYHCTFSCLGYETQEQTVEIKSGTAPLNITIVLETKQFELQEVVVSNKEDPAYAIMRKAIEKAPYHAGVVKEYTCEAYVKGSGKSIHIPKLIENLAKKDGEDISIYKDKLFLQESFSEVKFTAPDHYERVVKAFSSSMPNDSVPEEAFGVATNSLYNPEYGYRVSPLNPKAFSYYKFQYEGFEETGGSTINKIKVTPKLKDSRFVEGYIYIADNSWDIRYAELTLNSVGSSYQTKTSYQEVSEDIFLPVSFSSSGDISIFGIKLHIDYLVSLKYSGIVLNDSLINSGTSKKDSEKKKQKEKKSLEIKPEDKFKTTSDSLAAKRDSLYWTDIRNIALNDEEIRSYARKDTLKAKADSIRQKELHPKFHWTDILLGGRTGGDSSKVTFKYGGITGGALCEYNFVDGWWLGQTVEIGIRRKTNSWWKIKPMAYWALSRKTLLWSLDTELSYAPDKLGKFSISMGSVSEDYSDKSGMLRIENALYSLLAGINDAKLYQKDYIQLSNEIDLANGFKSEIFTEMSKRWSIPNHTTYSFFGDEKDARPNRPPYNGDLNGQYEMLLRCGVQFSYTPEYYYKMENGKKEYVRSRFPRFDVSFQSGIPVNQNYSEFYRMEIGIHQNIRKGLFDRFFYYVNAGTFLNKNPFNYIDYKHFNSANQLVTGKMFESSFSLLPYYTYSTPDQWVQAFTSYNTDYLVLKRLPFLQGKLFSESLYGKYLFTPQKKHYTEWGYGVGIPGFGNIAVFAGFDRFDYNSWGVSISLPLFLQNMGYRK